MEQVEKLQTISVPPDGGWGWIVCFAYALSNIVVIPIMQSFGLIFKDKLKAIEMSATDVSLIINVNASFGMMMGLVNGSLLKKFGYRKVATSGGILISIGVILTSFANSFQFFLFSYGILTSLGFGLTMSAGSLALNSYFRVKRSLATGFAMTGTGLGPILMPLFISYLLDTYGTSGCVLIIGAMSMHSLVAAALFQPLKWHSKLQVTDQELTEMKKDKNELKDSLICRDASKEELNHNKSKFNTNRIDFIGSTLSIDHDVETKSIYGFETPLPRRKLSQSSAIFDTGKTRKRVYARSVSAVEKSVFQSTNSINEEVSLNEIIVDETDMKTTNENKTCMSRFIKFFDLNLLTDPIYINLMLGMSLAICAEINFSLLTPLILTDFNYSTKEVATIMSLIALIDIVFRFCAPFIADLFNLPPKAMYVFSLILLILTRTGLLFVTNYSGMMAVATGLGVAKGFRTVFMSLLIPSYVPIEKLASASGIQMVANGIIILIGGPILGVIRDFTGSYSKCIIVINVTTFVTILMWTTEYIYRRFFKRN